MKIKLIIAIVFLFGIFTQGEAQIQNRKDQEKKTSKTGIERKIDKSPKLKALETKDTPRPRSEKQVPSGDLNQDASVQRVGDKQVRFHNGSFSTNEIYFIRDTEKISPSSFSMLDEIAKYILDIPDFSFHLTILAHTSGEANAKANEELSKARANSIKIYFNTKHGINKNQISIVGKDYQGIRADKQSDGEEIAISHVEFKIDKAVPKTRDGEKSDFKKESL